MRRTYYDDVTNSNNDTAIIFFSRYFAADAHGGKKERDFKFDRKKRGEA